MGFVDVVLVERDSVNVCKSFRDGGYLGEREVWFRPPPYPYNPVPWGIVSPQKMISERYENTLRSVRKRSVTKRIQAVD